MSSKNWESMENIVVGLGTWSWLVVLAAAILDIALGFYYLWWFGIFTLGLGFGGLLGYTAGLYIWYIIAGAIELVLLFIYVLKTFVPKIKAKDWNFLLSDSIFAPKFPKMLFFGILLFVFAPGMYYVGGILVVIPALLIMFAAPKSGNSAPAKSSKKAKKEDKPVEKEPAPAEEEASAEEEVKPAKKAAKRAKKAA
ncbi:MAG TPA: hypothetical protein VKM55_13940 [Candidatus Lokiarchaeia archaeon]|nr:hypothetical protein [Candidatus Lokiarchaeia archaeon]